jgi:antitoxin (DNA-binding transcriptional repressor) of toxin-antitoxin stability system
MRIKTVGDGFSLDLVHYLVYKLTMIRLNVHEAKTHLSRYLEKVAEGESILLCRRNIPVAEIRPLPKRQKAQRSIGLAKGLFKIPKSFFEPLPSDVVKSFYGKRK